MTAFLPENMVSLCVAFCVSTFFYLLGLPRIITSDLPLIEKPGSTGLTQSMLSARQAGQLLLRTWMSEPAVFPMALATEFAALN